MSKFIIYNKTELSDEEAMKRVLMVIQEGKISQTKRGKQYCLATTFKSGEVVICNKLREETYTFRVERS